MRVDKMIPPPSTLSNNDYDEAETAEDILRLLSSSTFPDLPGRTEQTMTIHVPFLRIIILRSGTFKKAPFV